MLMKYSCIAKGTSGIEGKWSYEILIVLQFAFVCEYCLRVCH